VFLGNAVRIGGSAMMKESEKTQETGYEKHKTAPEFKTPKASRAATLGI